MTMHDRTTPTVGGALTAPANLRAICAARDAALEQMERAAAALCAAYDLTADAADTAKAAHGGWHSPRTDRREEATRIMLHVHQHGVGVCGVFTYEVAETKVAQVIETARRHQHPLQCTMEKD